MTRTERLRSVPVLAAANFRALPRILCVSLPMLVAFSAPGEIVGTEVEGDANLLRVVRDAQLTNAAQLQRGAIRCSISDRLLEWDCRATVIWDGEKGFWDYEFSEPDSPTRSGKGRPGRRTEVGRFIDDGKVQSFYFPDSRVAQVIDDQSSTYRNQFKVRPSDIWFKLEGIHRWSTLLDPDREAKHLKLIVREKSPELVEIDYCNQLSGEVMRIVASLAHGGNIIEYKTHAHERDPRESGAFWRRGKYDWQLNESGVWSLKHLEYQRSSTGSPKDLHFDISVDVESFDANPQIPGDRFQFSSLEVGDGTVVEQLGSSPKTYRIGDRPRISQRQLEELAEKLRRGRFAGQRK